MNDRNLTCSRCSNKQSLETLAGKCDCGGAFLVEYDLEKVRHSFTKSVLARRVTSMWRYHELLPVVDLKSIVSLGEGWTPLLRLNHLEQKIPVGELWIKREEQNPTGSFKARGFSAAISLLNERKFQKVAVPSNGNAASALSAYAARSGMEAYVFIPKDCPGLIVEECIHYGACTYLVDGFIHDAAKIIVDGQEQQGWFNVDTLREPGRVEGKKTMGFEIAEQLDWKVPDVIVYPTGGGSGIIGLWKAFLELKELGFVEGDLPRLVSVQEEGCQPIVDAFVKNSSSLEPITSSVTANPTGMRVPNPPDGSLILSILKPGFRLLITRKADQLPS